MRKSTTQRRSPLHALSGITWMGNYSHMGKGYWVRVNSQRLSKTFLVADHGTKTAALRAAVRWRDRMRRRHPSSKLLRYKFRDKRSKTGIVGVCRNRQVKKSPNGGRRTHWYWIANWTDMDGTIRKRCWSINKYGETVARRLAIHARRKAIGNRTMRPHKVKRA